MLSFTRYISIFHKIRLIICNHNNIWQMRPCKCLLTNSSQICSHLSNKRIQNKIKVKESIIIRKECSHQFSHVSKIVSINTSNNLNHRIKKITRSTHKRTFSCHSKTTWTKSHKVLRMLIHIKDLLLSRSFNSKPNFRKWWMAKWRIKISSKVFCNKTCKLNSPYVYSQTNISHRLILRNKILTFS